MPRASRPSHGLDVARIRADFPILRRTVRDGRPLVYLDSRRHVAEAACRCSTPSGRSTSGTTPPCTAARTSWPRRPPTPTRARAPRSPRSSARRADEVVFTKNATEGINLVAYALCNAATSGPEAARFVVGPGDEIVVTEMEHHANLVPWQMLAPAHRRDAALVRRDRRRPARPVRPRRRWSTRRTKVVAFTHQSNVLGTVNPVDVARPARARGRRAGRASTPAQSVPHQPVDVAELGADFLGVLRPQDARPDRHRRAVGPVRAARGDAAVPHRRLDDRGRPHGGHHVRRAAAAVRGRRPDGRAGGRARRGRRLPDRARAWTRVAAHEHDADRATRSSGLAAMPGVRVIGPTDADRPRRRGLVRGRRHPPARRRPGAGRPRRRGPGRAPLRVAAAPPLRRAGHDPGVVLRLQRRGRRRRAGRRRPARAGVLRRGSGVA